MGCLEPRTMPGHRDDRPDGDPPYQPSRIQYFRILPPPREGLFAQRSTSTARSRLVRAVLLVSSIP